MGTKQEDHALKALTVFVPTLLSVLSLSEILARAIHPGAMASFVENVGNAKISISDALSNFEQTEWPSDWEEVKNRLDFAGNKAVECFSELDEALKKNSSDQIYSIYRAFRHQAQALEALYPLAAALPPVNRFFVLDKYRQDGSLLDALAARETDVTGLFHAENERKQRGGVSLYVPETYDPAIPMPVVFALHGGSGHGRSFIWSWLRAARSFGAILVCPTSQDATWSLLEPEQEAGRLYQLLDRLSAQWAIRRDKLLLTGMSDGGTFSYVAGLEGRCPFTHLAPMAASFHPMLAAYADPARVAGLPIYITHGALDWMFAADMAFSAADAFRAGGANVTLDVVEDLSHTFPSEKTEDILTWFLA